jgi:hypothetical protein
MFQLAGSSRIPKYRLHRPSGQAVARFNGIDYYLGKHGSQESRDEYDRLLGEWMIKGRQPPRKSARSFVGQMTVNELILAYLQFADGYYRKNGQPTGEYDSIRYSLKPLRRLYGSTGVNEFGPLALKNVREEMITSALCRNEINKRVGRIVRMFKWGVESGQGRDRTADTRIFRNVPNTKCTASPKNTWPCPARAASSRGFSSWSRNRA